MREIPRRPNGDSKRDARFWLIGDLCAAVEFEALREDDISLSQRFMRQNPRIDVNNKNQPIKRSQQCHQMDLFRRHTDGHEEKRQPFSCSIRGNGHLFLCRI